MDGHFEELVMYDMRSLIHSWTAKFVVADYVSMVPSNRLDQLNGDCYSLGSLVEESTLTAVSLVSALLRPPAVRDTR